MEPDIIVIGGGSAGCAVAGRLAQQGRRVVVLEAGGSDRDVRVRVPALMAKLVQNPQFDWCYFCEPDPSVGGRPSPWPAGKRLGGGSAINGMMFIRGHRWDYDNWAKLGATGWDYQSVLPSFRRLEDNERGADHWRGTGGPVAVSECRSRYPVTDAWIAAAIEAGIARSPDLNGEKAEGVDHIQLSQRRGWRNTTSTYLHGLAGGLTPQVLLEAQVLKLEIESGRAVGVTYRQGGETRTLRARQGVVLSAGALNTPRLLMLSGIGPADHLREVGVEVVRDVPGIGENLQDHCGTHLIDTVDALTLNNDANGWRAPLQLLRMAFGRGALSTGIGHAQAFVRSREGLPAPNLQLAFSAFSFEVTPQGNVLLRPESSVATFVGLMRPSSRGSSLAVLQATLVVDALRAHPDDMRAASRAYEAASKARVEPWYEMSLLTDKPEAANLAGFDLQSMRRATTSEDPEIAVLVTRMMSLLTTPQELFSDAALVARLQAAGEPKARPHDPNRKSLTREDILAARPS